MTNVSGTTTWSIPYDCHSDDRNIFFIKTGVDQKLGRRNDESPKMLI